MEPTLALKRRRALRRDSTDVEMLMWRLLRGRRFEGQKFRRQHPCGPYILDFYCPARNLAIELDGGGHFTDQAEAYDARRDAFLASRGIRVLRFPNDRVMAETEAVLETILDPLRGRP